MGGYENGRSVTNVKGENRAIFGTKLTKKRFDGGEVFGGFEKPKEGAYDWYGRRSWWEIFSMEEEREKRSRNAENGDEQEPWIHE